MLKRIYDKAVQLFKTDQVTYTYNQGISIKLLNAIENAMFNYGRVHNMNVNVYWFFGNQLGYKSRNQLYKWFSRRDDAKIGIYEIIQILKITQDVELYEIVVEEIGSVLKIEKPLVDKNSLSIKNLTFSK